MQLLRTTSDVLMVKQQGMHMVTLSVVLSLQSDKAVVREAWVMM